MLLVILSEAKDLPFAPFVPFALFACIVILAKRGSDHVIPRQTL